MIKGFKERWEIQQNWQLIFPLVGLILLIYSSYKLTNLLLPNLQFPVSIFVIIGMTYLLLKSCLVLFKKLEHKWIVTYKWEMIRIFLVFSLTGSSSVFIGRPIIKLLGITQANLGLFYWFCYIVIAIVFYQILLVIFGWLLGQFSFFWEFEKKMLRRFGLGRFLAQ